MNSLRVAKLVGIVLGLACCGVAGAQSIITVDTVSDAGTVTGNCELREAIQAAETNAAVDGCVAGSASNPDKIVFADALVGQTIAYSSSLLFASGSVIIDSQMRQIVLQASGGADALQISGGAVTIRGLDVRATGTGNGVTLGSGSITINNSSIQGRLGINAYGSPSTVTLNNATVASTETSALSDIAIRSGGSNNLVINNSTVVATVGKGLDVMSSLGTTDVYSSLIVGATPVNGSLTTSTGGTLQFTSTATAGLAAALANNGGPTRTFALLSGVAVDGGDCVSAPFPRYDQRFYMNYATNKRGVVTTCDVGAFEKDAQDLLAVQIFANGFEL